MNETFDYNIATKLCSIGVLEATQQVLTLAFVYSGLPFLLLGIIIGGRVAGKGISNDGSN